VWGIEREPRSLEQCQEEIRELERNKEGLLGRYPSPLPDALDGPDAEPHRVQKMLTVEAAIAPGGALEVSGDVLRVCKMETLST
jgi:hypothetical protein